MRRWATVSALLLFSAVLGACGGDGSGDQPSRGADTAEEAVTGLVSAIESAEFDRAASLARPGQAALASLAEAATFDEVASALEGGDAAVASNFWTGFAQEAGGYLSGASVVGVGAPIVEGEVEYHPVIVKPLDGPERTFFVVEEDGYRVDLFASLAAGMAPRMVAPVERLLTTDTADARLILAELEATVPSLLVAARSGDQPAEATQQIVRLIELITRRE